MKAIVCRSHGPLGSLRWEALEPKALACDEVRIEVHAAGVNFADTLKVQGMHQVKVELPWVPGAEAAGVVAELGAAVRHWRIGDRVVGVPGDQAGCFAESVALHGDRVLRVPEEVPLCEAAALPAAYGTALYALLQRAGLASGEWILVLGAAGGVGLAAVQLAAIIGARVIAGASTEVKRQIALENGAAHVVDYTRPDWRKEVLSITGSGGVQVVFDPVGGDVFDEAVRTVGWSGRYLVIGFAAGRIPALRVNHALVKGYDLLGVRYDVWRDRCWPQARDNLERILAWCSQRRLRPLVSRVEPLEHAIDALSAVASRRTTGKVILASAAAAVGDCARHPRAEGVGS